jgi:hypothetical protein
VLNIPQTPLSFLGSNTIVHWSEKGQMQPELASGIATTPLAGMQLIQHPGRWAPKWAVP